jgi:serine/threonine protein kinase
LIQLSEIDPQAAAAYILQSSAELKYAHDHGVHRDVSSANLLLRHRIPARSKLPTWGWSKPLRRQRRGESEESNAMLASARTQVTGTNRLGNAGLHGTRQADATNVDHRADIYSLGCTFMHTDGPSAVQE